MLLSLISNIVNERNSSIVLMICSLHPPLLPEDIKIVSIEISTHPRPLPPTSTEQDLVVSSSEPLTTDTSLSNLTSLASIEMEDLPAATVDASTQTTPVKPVSKQTLWGWLRRTEIKSNALDLLARLLFLIFLVGLGTFFLIEYSTAAEATAKANRLALFTARVSFPDQPKIYTLNFCEKSSDTGLHEFAKCEKPSKLHKLYKLPGNLKLCVECTWCFIQQI
ncbi:hypothetical protein BofuT4_P081080.1 [Botrytis cinerea T4]|uniref:Uncharacterized protein n=1 Tax=Botryotinia fuckeliana (strain T4) TaxID=999810 RepID=G2YL15_BOTF4|nr:hypothetical protein BofuT4_P081080.1 [Botrytis cinerea T4]